MFLSPAGGADAPPRPRPSPTRCAGRWLRTGLVIAVALATLPLGRAADFPEKGRVKRNGGFRMEGYWCWDPTVIKGEDGKYHLFASRWPKEVSFHPGWMTDAEVVHAVATDPAGPYLFRAVVLPRRGAEYWDGLSTFNPTVRKFGDTYLMFYAGSTNPLGIGPRQTKFELNDPRCLVGRANKRIGLATAKSLDGPWERSDRPILETKAGTFYSFLTSNPAPVVRPDGSVVMIFKARSYVAPPPDQPGAVGTYSRMVLGLARAPHFRGPYQVVGDSPLFGPAQFGEVEDPFLWQNPDGSYEMIAKDMTGKIVGERHAGIHAVSRDAVTWQLAAKPKAWTRTIVWDDGQEEVVRKLERPFILFEDGRPRFLFGAIGRTGSSADSMAEAFDIAIPLR